MRKTVAHICGDTKRDGECVERADRRKVDILQRAGGDQERPSLCIHLICCIQVSRTMVGFRMHISLAVAGKAQAVNGVQICQKKSKDTLRDPAL